VKILLVEAFEVGDNPLVADWLMQPYGLMLLAGVLRESNFKDVRILDTKIHAEPIKQLNECLRTFKPDVVGLRSLSASAGFLHELLENIKQQDPSIVTVSGGPHANANPLDCLDDFNLDYIVLNEGEITFPELLRVIGEGGDPANVKGIGFRRDGRAVFTDPRPFITNLDEISFPAWDLIDHNIYRDRFYSRDWGRINYVQVRQDSMPLFTSRACPFNCIYCHKIFGRKYRANSPERVLEEIDILYDKYNVCQFDFYDDIFNLDRKRTEAILNGIIERRMAGKDIKLSFFNGLRGDIQDSLLIKLFKDAGTFLIPYAIETAAPRLQKLIRKNLKLDKLKRVISFTARMNIITVGFSMLGFPTETREEAEGTIRYMLEAGFDVVEFFIVSPYYGTALADMVLEKFPHLGHRDMSNMNFLKAKYVLSKIPPKELEELYIDAFKRLLLDRKRISRLNRKIRYHREH